jgi:MscS family membrane protein
MAILHATGVEGDIFEFLNFMIKVIFNFSVVWIAYNLSSLVGDFLQARAMKTDFELDDQLVPLISKTLRLLTLVIGVLMALENLNYNVMSVVAGLGLGGLAFALAAKDTAANIFGSMMILSDRPFRVGDWVKFRDVEGVIEEVGFRSTKVRTFYNSLISVPNSVVAQESIDNFGRRAYRRVKTNLGITYDTPPEKVEAFLEGLKNIVKANPRTRKDYYHVVFSGFGPSSLDIMLYFFLRVPDWSEELVERQNIYLEILRLANRIGVDFAFPTQSVHVESFPDKNPHQRHQEDWSTSNLKQNASLFGPKGDQSRPSGLGIFVPPSREGK